jgi:hypothetical protein
MEFQPADYTGTTNLDLAQRKVIHITSLSRSLTIMLLFRMILKRLLKLETPKRLRRKRLH